eukprot:96425-Pelagomonas_calceolata.AAC.6
MNKLHLLRRTRPACNETAHAVQVVGMLSQPNVGGRVWRVLRSALPQLPLDLSELCWTSKLRWLGPAFFFAPTAVGGKSCMHACMHACVMGLKPVAGCQRVNESGAALSRVQEHGHVQHHGQAQGHWHRLKENIKPPHGHHGPSVARGWPCGHLLATLDAL